MEYIIFVYGREVENIGTRKVQSGEGKGFTNRNFFSGLFFDMGSKGGLILLPGMGEMREIILGGAVKSLDVSSGDILF